MDRSLTLEAVIRFLVETDLFRGLEPTELSQIVQLMQVQRFRAGQYLFREGDEGDAWYVLYEGEAQVDKENPFGPDRAIAMLGSHACFGEMAILDGTERSASVRAVSDLTVFRFPRDRFCELLDDGSLAAFKLVYGMARILSARQRNLTHQVAELVDGGLPAEHTPLKGRLGPLLDTMAVSE